MDARYSANERNYNQIRGIAVRLKSVATGYRADMDADLPVRSLINIHKGMKHLKTTLNNLYSPAVKDVATALHDLAGDLGYDLAADLSALGVLIDAVNTEVVALAPLSVDGSVKERTIDVNGEVELLIPVADMATLRTLFDNLIAAIIV